MAQLSIQQAFRLAVQHHQAGRLREAEQLYRQILSQQPNHADALHYLGVTAAQVARNDIAIDLIRRAIALGANPAEAHGNLASALKNNGKLDEAIAAFRHALTLAPSAPEVYVNLGNALQDIGQLDEAIAAFRQAMALRPNHVQAHSHLIYALHHHPAYDARAIAEELGRWNRQHAARLTPTPLTPSSPSTGSGQASSGRVDCTDRSPGRPLRIGYVSPDFRDHAVGQNLLPLFHHHDRRQFEITCYAHVLRPDAMTRHFQQNADRWRSIVGLSDDQVAQQVREDRIDILVDLALHTVNNRLLVFARKPAPVQVTFAGYPGRTGLSAIDYRLSDPYLDPFDAAQGGPPGMDESVYSEQTIRLPDSFWCYDPLEGREIPVNSLPALERGVVTFGCLNNFCKVNESVLSLWAQVLRQVEKSRLLLLAPHGSHRQWTVDRLRQEGIDPGRIEFVPRQPPRKYLEIFHRIDLGLDTFPYNGHTSGLDSFWMGVPVVTLVGQTAVSRAGWCQLSNLGLSKLAGHTAGQFVQIAVELAKNLPMLQALRSTLRTRMEQSPLMDAPKFARDIESAYRQMWRTWCETVSARS